MDVGMAFDLSPDHFDRRNIHAGDEKLPVKFRIDAVKDEGASETAGRPIYRDAEFIQIFKSRNDIIDREVRDSDKERWPRAYAAWKNSGDSDPGAMGTRLEHWPQMTRAQCEEFRYFKVFTVEGLADLPDSTAQKIMGAIKLRAQARIYVESAKGEAPFIKLQGEIDKRDQKIEQLQAEVSRLAKLIEDKLMPVPVS